jgi:nitroimidazol reductase NimA-like FMN-containing flavoprotein (pyridoxamine 5'-phosphate oxidase superfamily)
MSFAMTKPEREAFLADVRIGIISIAAGERGPLTVPIWYDYRPGGELWFVTERASRKAKLLSGGSRVSLCVQTEAPPYKYVSVEGPIISIDPADVERDTRPMAHRYLGPELGDQYIEATMGGDARAEGVVVRMRPERWLSVDYAKQFQV